MIIKSGKEELTLQPGKNCLIDNGCCYQFAYASHLLPSKIISEKEFIRVKKAIQTHKVKGKIEVKNDTCIYLYLI